MQCVFGEELSPQCCLPDVYLTSQVTGEVGLSVFWYNFWRSESLRLVSWVGEVAEDTLDNVLYNISISYTLFPLDVYSLW